ncbi:MAG: diheme cytochrome c [Azovibrio sp.]|uniref:diheme cytochrome c n=1 Tax=Azovibrio sp. TaxID=1872673 RepID=UPI003C72B760
MPRPVIRPLLLGLAALGISAALYSRAQAGGEHYFPPVQDKTTLAECGSCHLAYPAAMLPAASWKKMMANLDPHFGDNASLDPQTTAAITRYLVDHAGDTGGSAYGRKLLRGVAAGDAPQRITTLPKWVKEHREVPKSDWARKEVGTKANCAACHQDAERGYFEED